MSNTIESTANRLLMNDTATDAPGFFKRSAVLVYGVVSYAVGVGGLMWLILAMGGLAPVSIGALETTSMVGAISVNLGLVLLFGLQHSIMARAHFKRWITQVIPPAAERATYVLMSGVVTMLAIYFWQPLPGTVWSIENSVAQIVLWSAYAIGWAYLFIATFVTNHFELMGLRQVYLYYAQRDYTQLPFTRKLMYRYSRHPMMLGILIGMWALPVMSVSHFVMSLLFTLYIIVGVYLEEKDLVTRFGDTYSKYKKEIATLIPRLY